MAITKVTRNLLSTGIDDQSNATAITIDSSENVGIGETTPLGKIHAKVSDTGASASAQGNLLVLEDTENGLSILSGTSAAGYINFGDSDDNDIGMIIYDHSANAMRFWTNAAERMRIDTNGNVGIGQTSVGHKLTVNASAFDGIQLQSGGSDCGYLGVNTDTVYVGAGSNLIFHTGNAGLTNGTERMRIDSNGNVGIGTTSPSYRLHVNSGVDGISAGIAGTTYGIRFDNGGSFSSGMSTIHGVDDTLTGSYQPIMLNGSDVRFGTSATERMRIDSSGRVLIGHSSAVGGHSELLGIDTDSASGFGIFISGNASSATQTAIRFYDSGASAGVVGSITFATSSTAYNTSSDYRLKENVDYTWDATTRLKQLKPARFNFKSDETNTLVDGFLAHEVSGIVPEAITGEKDAVDSEGNPEYQGIDQSKLVPLLVKTIQELEARITTLEG